MREDIYTPVSYFFSVVLLVNFFSNIDPARRWLDITKWPLLFMKC